MDKKIKQMYRYWISKSDNILHKEIVNIQKIKVADRYVYIAYNKNHRHHDEIESEQFETNMLQRSLWQSIYLYTENDELAIKHFEWAISEKIKVAKSQIAKCKNITLKLNSEG